MVTDVTLAFVSIVLPLVICNICNSLLFAFLAIDKYIYIISLISPSRFFCICDSTKNGHAQKILVVRQRLVSDESNRNKLMIAVCVIYLHFIALVVFIYCLFTIEYGCSPMTTTHDWSCYEEYNVLVNCTKTPHKVTASCIRYTGNPPYALTVAYVVFQFLCVVSLLLAYLYEIIEKKFGKYCLFCVVALCIVFVNILVAAIHSAIFPDFKLMHPFFMKYFMLTTIFLSTLCIRGVADDKKVLPGQVSHFDEFEVRERERIFQTEKVVFKEKDFEPSNLL